MRKQLKFKQNRKKSNFRKSLKFINQKAINCNLRKRLKFKH